MAEQKVKTSEWENLYMVVKRSRKEHIDFHNCSDSRLFLFTSGIQTKCDKDYES